MTQERFNAEYLVLSSAYRETMAEEVLPYLDGRRREVRVEGADKRPLYCCRYDAERPRGTVLIVHGFTENAYKYSELIYSLLRSGFSVAAYDQRGHGRSWRAEGIDDLSLTHVDSFTDYVRDLQAVVDGMTRDMPGPLAVFGHSMGGAVAALYMEERPDVFSRAVLCAPMIRPLTGMPGAVTQSMCGLMKLLGKGRSRVFVSKPYTEREAFETSCAAGRERFDWYEDVRQAHPEYRNNGPTYGWTLESVRVTRRILAPGAPEKITCPVLLFTAGLDTMVDPKAQEQFIGRVRQGTRVVVDGAKHEIYRSGDEVLFPWWRRVLTHLGA